MATNAAKTRTTKPSFASVAAMAPPPKLNDQRQRKPENEKLISVLGHGDKAAAVESSGPQQLQEQLQKSVSHLAIKETPPASSPPNDQQRRLVSRAGLRSDEDRTQISSSSTKPASMDGKSTGSATTFALDEKESLRPDDSASAKAAEDDELGSGPASGTQNSRVGSEAGSRAFRDQFHEINENMGSSSLLIQPRSQPRSRKMIAGIEEEQTQKTHSPHPSGLPAPVNPPPAQLMISPGTTICYEYHDPDEKLLEALESPKDRLFLLKLEQEVIHFIQDPSEPPMIDLPPCNSFCRLLAHKLADYYALTHFVDNAVSSVRLYRTPYCQIRPSLSAIAVTPTILDTTPLAQPAMKIMRRAGLGKDGQNSSSEINTTASSMAPSKAGSENGFDSQQGTGVASPTDSSIAKEKSVMTREEREAKYKETRERIFGSETDNANSDEAAKEASRTSSRNEKKKKKHRNNDDGFTARSQYNAYYPSMSYSTIPYEQTGDPSIYYSPYAIPPSGTVSQTTLMSESVPNQNYQPEYPPIADSQAFTNMMTGNPMMTGYEWQNGASYQSQIPRDCYPQMQQISNLNMDEQSPPMPSPATSQLLGPQYHVSDQQWAPHGYAYQYQQPRDAQQYFPPYAHSQNQMAGMQSVPYQFGQLPMQTGIRDNKAQHPLPGSYKSQSFNPQTRAFIPSSGGLPPQLLHQGNTIDHPLSRSVAMPFQNGGQYPGYSQQAPFYPPVPSLPTSSPYSFGHEAKNHGARKTSVQSSATQSPRQSSLSKWGTPANLPPKPPPPETPNIPEGQHSLPLNNHFNVNVQPTNGGQPMPSFQNGVYTMPGTTTQTT